ncbi:MAG: ABC transporter ATP-binding protein [Ruminococcaceae bacterium]|nr:ABC transporter ATP-binding protein [Oscillospiraceae bacterium]
MDNLRQKRLEEKYSRSNSSNGTVHKEMNVMGRPSRDGMHQSGKPKDIKKTVIRLLKHLSRDRVPFSLAIFCALICTVSTISASYMLRPIINKFIYYDPSDANERTKGLLLWVIIMAIVYGISVLTQWLQQRIMLTVSQKALGRMREQLYEKLQTLPVRYFDTHTAGDIMSRFTNDTDTIGEMLNTTLIQILSGIITIIGTVILSIYTNPILGGITVIMTPILTVVSKEIVKKSRSCYTEQQKALGMLNGFSEEIISGQKVVKVFNHEQYAGDEFSYLNDKLCNAQIKAQFRAGIMGPVTHQLCNLIYGVTACVGGLLVVLKGFDIGGLAVSLNYTRQFNRPINEISMQINTVFAALAGAERVFEILDEKEEEGVADIIKPQTIKGHIILDKVSFGYVPGVTVLHDISLYAKPGQKIAFVGSTGAGKTTVTNLLSRFYDIEKGSITIDGMDIEKIDRSVLRKNIAMVLQDVHLFTGTVRENIRYGRLDATDEEVEQAAKIASAHSFIVKLENGYDTMLEHDGANLSQGQRQLLAIARAAISRAPILILDEATSSVDTRTEKHIEEGMDALMEDRTTFVIAHRLSTVRKANAIMVLEKGRIIERGTHEELLEAKGRYSDLYNEISELD